MRNVYDITRELTESLRETDQFKTFSMLKKQIDADARLKSMLDDFQQKNMTLQAQMMTGQKDEKLQSQVQSLYSIIMSDPKAASYLQAQYALSQIVSDIYRTIGEAINA